MYGSTLPATGGIVLGVGFLADPTSGYFFLGLFALIAAAGALWRIRPGRRSV